jgi:hypothetical protein
MNSKNYMKAEVLSVVVSKLQASRDAVMLDVNVILNGDLTEGVADRLIYKIQELGSIEKSLEQANAFYSQSVAHLAKESNNPELANKVQEILDKTKDSNDNTA